MTAQKHTEGAIELADDIITYYESTPKYGGTIGLTIHGERLSHIATLIDKYTAAAPATAKQRDDLLAALKRLVSQFAKWEGYHDWVEEDAETLFSAEAAISAVEDN